MTREAASQHYRAVSKPCRRVLHRPAGILGQLMAPARHDPAAADDHDGHADSPAPAPAPAIGIGTP